MQCAYLKGEPILLLQTFPDGTAEVAQKGEIKKLKPSAAALITTRPLDQPKEKRQGFKPQFRLPIRALRDCLLFQPTLLKTCCKEVGVSLELGEQVKEQILLEYQALGCQPSRPQSKARAKVAERERRIEALAAEGLAIREIALRLGMSKTGVGSALDRINARQACLIGTGRINRARIGHAAEGVKPPKPMASTPSSYSKPKLPKLSSTTQALCDRIDAKFKEIWSAQRLAIAA